MLNCPLAKYYQKNIGSLLRRAQKMYHNLLEEEKSDNMVANNLRIFLEIRNKSWLSIEKHYKMGKNKNAS